MGRVIMTAYGPVKECSRCHAVKPLAQYKRRADRPNSPQAECRQCAQARYKQWEQAHPDHLKKWREANRAHVRAYRREYMRKQESRAFLREPYEDDTDTGSAGTRRTYDDFEYHGNPFDYSSP